MVRRLASEDGHTALCRIEPAIRMQRPPRHPLLLFSDAVGPLPGMAQHSFVELTCPASAYVPENQADRPADSGVGTTSAREDIVAGIKAEPLDCGPAHDEERRSAVSGGLNTVEVEAIRQHGAQCGQDYRDIFRKAAGHHAVDSDLLHGGYTLIGRYDPDDLLRIIAEIIQNSLDEAWRGKDHRKSVGPTQTIDLLHCSLIVFGLDHIEFCQLF